MYIKTIKEFRNEIDNLNKIIISALDNNILDWCKHPDIDKWDKNSDIENWCNNQKIDCKKWKEKIDSETDEENKCALKCKFAAMIQSKAAEIIKNKKINLPTIIEQLGLEGHEIGEIASWIFSLPVLAKILTGEPDGVPDNAQIVLEAHYGTSERADVVIVGTNGDKKVMIFIENKRWQCVKMYEPVSDYCVRNPFSSNEYIAHPCIQVWRYKYLMKNTNSFVQKNEVETCSTVLMHNVKIEEIEVKKGIFDERFSGLIKKNPIFIEEIGRRVNGESSLKDYIKEKITGGEKDLAERIYESELSYSNDYIKNLSTLFCQESNNSQELKRILSLLLDEDQLSIFEEISEKVNGDNKANNNKDVYILEGRSGTGKSFLALALLSYFYINNKKNEKDKGPTAKCLLKNKDLRKYFNKYFGDQNDKIPRMEGILAAGINGDLDTEYDCIICDEAQRMPETIFQSNNKRTIETIINKSKKVAIFFWDSRQSVSVNDYIKRYKIEQSLINLNKDKESHIQHKCIVKKLKFQHRASDEFLDFLNDILYSDNQGNVKEYKNNEEGSYVVRLVKSPKDLKNIIARKNNFKCSEKDVKNRVYPSRMLAGKGCSKDPTKDWCWLDFDDTAIGPLGSEEYYLMWEKHYKNSKEFKNIQSYVLDSKSVGRVGCVDSSQGLDFEYVGVIIAPDLYYNGTNVEVELGGHRLMDLNLYNKYNDSNNDYKTSVDNKGVFDKNKYIELKQKKYGKELIEEIYKEIKAPNDEELNKKIYKEMHKEIKALSDEELNKFIEIIQESDENEVYEKLGKQLFNNIIKNTYNVLLSRGEKGCFIYCCDKTLEKYLKDKNIKYYKFIANKRTKVFHAEDCQYVQNISKKDIFNTSEDAISEGYKPCKSCKPCNVYIGNKNRKVFHMADCQYVQNISEKDIFNTSEDAISEGYKPCKSCKPPHNTYIGNKNRKVFHTEGCSYAENIGSIDNKKLFFSRKNAINGKEIEEYRPCKVCQKCNMSTKCPYFNKNQNDLCGFCPLLGI